MKRWAPASAALLLLASLSGAVELKTSDAPPELIPAQTPLVQPLDAAAVPASPATLSAAPLEATALPPAAVPAAATAAPKTAAAAAPGGVKISALQQLVAASALAPADPKTVSALVARTQARTFDGVFIQQEHEGNLLAADPRDSSGDVFRYYRPAALRPELVAKVKAGMTLGEKAAYALRFLTTRDEWKRLPTTSKLNYLIVAEQAAGPNAAWRDNTFLLLTKTKAAPSYLAEHPVMEVPPPGTEHLPYQKFLRPEIVTAQDAPAASIREAIGRAKAVIGDTAHAGVHFHVFVKLKTEDLRRRLPAVEALLQLANNAYYAEAAAKNPLNLAHAFLTPWHQGRSARVEQLVAEAAPAVRVSEHGDPDAEKFAFLAFRYWGTQDGLTTVSFELRGVGIPMVREGAGSGLGRGIEGAAPTFRRDYGEPERRLALLMLFSAALERGDAPLLDVPQVRLDAAAAEKIVAARARQRGLPEGSYLSLAEFSRVLFGAPHGYEGPHPGLLLPFSPGAAEPSAEAARGALVDAFLDQSARLKALQKNPAEAAAQLRNVQYLFWSAYADWSRRFGSAQQAKLDRLLVALAR